MPQTTITRQDFERTIGDARKAAASGPVVITDGGKPSQVLLSFDDYRKLTRPSLADVLAMPDDLTIDFDPQVLDLKTRPADFS